MIIRQYWPFILLALLVVSLLFLLLLLVFRRKSPYLPPLELVERVSRRLDQLDALHSDIQNLSRLFLVPHSRGALGETLLGELLKNWLPSSAYSLQYTFKNGARVDAVIHLKPYLIPIDSKFPLEAFIRAEDRPENSTVSDSSLKKTFIKHIGDIAQKYIQPAAGTMRFALMYIPSERIYYQVFVEDKQELMETALKNGVVPVSPSGLFLYLQTVAYGLKGFLLREDQQEIQQQLHQLRVDYNALNKSLLLYGSHLKNLSAVYDVSLKQLTKLERGIQRMEQG